MRVKQLKNILKSIFGGRISRNKASTQQHDMVVYDVDEHSYSIADLPDPYAAASIGEIFEHL